MKVIGLTGGIASGKSTVTSILRQRGYNVIDVDIVARHIVDKGTEAWEQIIQHFGQDILEQDGSINRKKLGNIVFAEKSKLHLLNSITHPYIIQRVRERISELQRDSHEDAVFVDAAILIEMGLNKYVDEIWVVTIDKELQIKRLMDRDQLSYPNALNRVNAQMPLDEKVKYATKVIDNSKGIEDVKEQVENLLVTLKME